MIFLHLCMFLMIRLSLSDLRRHLNSFTTSSLATTRMRLRLQRRRLVPHHAQAAHLLLLHDYGALGAATLRHKLAPSAKRPCAQRTEQLEEVSSTASNVSNNYQLRELLSRRATTTTSSTTTRHLHATTDITDHTPTRKNTHFHIPTLSRT